MRKILYAAAEAVPFASSGGLGDVMGSLPYAVKKIYGEDADIRVVIPMYPSLRKRFMHELQKICETEVTLAWRKQYCGIWFTCRGDVTYYFIDNEYYFQREEMYGSCDDGERFAFFGKAILALMNQTDFIPDILHANDWQTAPVVIYLKRKTQLDTEYRNIRILYTIHNIAYQGIFDFSAVQDVFELAEWDRPVVEYHRSINLMKGAIVCADRISTVSPRYASEIQTEYYACGLHEILQSYAGKLIGITNGIDTDTYNSTTLTESEPYSAEHLAGKQMAKQRLQEMCDLPRNRDVPLIGMVSRLTKQKGYDLVMRILEDFLHQCPAQFVLLGKGDPEIEAYFLSMQQKYPQQCSVRIQYDRDFATSIYAGADLFLMPSQTEPCGLAQMIASRYGAVPLVRETGGLADTIHPYNWVTGDGNGFTFKNYNAHDMMYVMKQAAALYQKTEKWQALVRQVMLMDFSWEKSAGEYRNLYESML